MKNMRVLGRLCAVTIHEALAEGVWWALALVVLTSLTVRGFLSGAENSFAAVERDLIGVAFAFFSWLVSLVLPVVLWRSELERDVFAMLFARGVRPWIFFAGKYLGLAAVCSILWAGLWVASSGAVLSPARLVLKSILFFNVMTFLACWLGRALALMSGVLAYVLGSVQGLAQLADAHPVSLLVRVWQEVGSVFGPHFEFFDPGSQAASERPAAVAAYAALYSAGCILGAFWCFRNKVLRASCGSGRSR